MFAAAGVREVWRFRDGNVSVFALGLGGYSTVPRSAVLPVLTADAITRFLEESRCMRRLEWIRCLRGWIQARTAN